MSRNFFVLFPCLLPMHTAVIWQSVVFNTYLYRCLTPPRLFFPLFFSNRLFFLFRPAPSPSILFWSPPRRKKNGQKHHPTWLTRYHLLLRRPFQCCCGGGTGFWCLASSARPQEHTANFNATPHPSGRDCRRFFAGGGGR